MADELLQSPLGIRLRGVLDAMDDDVRSALADLGITDYRSRFSGVVRALARTGPVPIRELASALGVTHSAASQSVTEMVKRGLLELVPGKEDGRQRVVHLTAATIAIKPALDAEYEATERAFAELNGELTATLGQVVTEMTEALSRRSFRQRIADAAAELLDIAPEHREALSDACGAHDGYPPR